MSELDEKILWDTREERSIEHDELRAKWAREMMDVAARSSPEKCYELVRSEYALAKCDTLNESEAHDLESVFQSYAKLDYYNLPDALRAVEAIRLVRQACRDRIYADGTRTM